MWSPGLDFQASGGEAAVDQVGPVLDLLQLALDDPDQAVQVGGGEVGDGPLEQRPDALGGIQLGRIRGQPVDPQPRFVLLGEVRQVRRQVDVEVIPAPHQRRGQLPVRGDDQVPVISPAEPLRLVLAAAVHAQLVKQVRPVPGPVARHPGDADPAAARAADPDHRAGAALRPGAALRRPQTLACLVLEADEGAQVARRAFISGHTWSFHTATAASSRSIAWRTGAWQDQPCRRISFEVPSTVYPTWNRRPISVLIRPSVHRWSLANPCASGPSSARAPAGPTAAGSASPATPAPSIAAPRCRRPARPGATA